MRLRRTTTLVAASALAGLSLGGCSFGTKASDTVPPTRVSHASHRPTTQPTPSPSPVASTSSPAAPSATPSTPSTPTATASAPESASPSAAPEHVTTYKRLVVKLPVADDAVPGAPAGFTDYLRSALDADWQKLGGTDGCEKAASIKVERISSLGFAMVARNIDPAIPTCVKAASYAGGYQAILGEKDGSWSQLLGLQDEPSCAKMTELGVPRSIYGKCL